MWYDATVADPAAEPLTTAEARLACRIDATDDDTLLDSSIATARAHVEAYTGLRIGTRTGVTMICDGWADLARLPESPVTSITSITYTDTDGATQTLATSVYELRATEIEAAIVLKYNQVWPSVQPGSRITVTAAIGFSTVPPPVKNAAALYVRHLYNLVIETGQQPVELPAAFHDLLVNFRRYA